MLSATLFFLGQAIAPPTPQVSASEPVLELNAEANRIRKERSIPALTANYELEQAAYAMATDLARRNVLEHQDGEGRKLRERVEAANYKPWRAIGENLAMGTQGAEHTVFLWMESDGHKKNLINPKFTEVGSAVVESPSGWVSVQIYGTR